MRSPITGGTIANVRDANAAAIGNVIDNAVHAFKTWRLVPAPRRGELVRLLAEELRAAKDELGRLVMIEAGKIASEGRGEVQEMIDICDFAVGLSRQLYGTDHCQRASRASHDGAMASLRSDRSDHHIQFSGGSVGLECSAGACLRRYRYLEAI